MMKDKLPLEENKGREELDSLVKNFVRVLGDELEKFPAEQEKSKNFKKEVREKIKNGARRTSGRIV